MRVENVESLWYAFYLIKAIILLFVFLAVAVLCKWLLFRISWKSFSRHPIKHAIVHYLGTLRSPQKVEALRSKAIDRSPGERRRRIG